MKDKLLNQSQSLNQSQLLDQEQSLNQDQSQSLNQSQLLDQERTLDQQNQGAMLFGIPFWNNTLEVLLNQLEKQLSNHSGGLIHICTPNPEHIMLAQKHKEFQGVLESADINVPDGFGVVLASRLLLAHDKQCKQRISGRELMFHVISLLNERSPAKQTVFFLGGKQGAAQQLAAQLAAQFPNILFKFDEGAKDISKETAEEKARVLKKIASAQPRLLFVAYGAPFQELWIHQHRQELEAAGVQVAMGVGGAFEMLLGTIPIAPEFAQKHGIEWLWRLAQEPWRWKRQLALVHFSIKTFQLFLSQSLSNKT